MTTIAVYSNKGGVGKTAAAVNLAYLAAQSGVPTLLCDLDAQGSATFYFRIKPKIKRKARGLAAGSKLVDESIKATNYANLDLLPADPSHRSLDLVYDKAKHPRRQLQEALAPLAEEYELILLDCPPTINMVAENVFHAADALLVPLIPTTLCLRAHALLLAFLNENGYAAQQWSAFFSMVDRRKKMHIDLMAAARREYRPVLESTIPYLSLVEQMGVQQEPVPAFAPRSPAAAAYRDLWSELARTALARQ